MEGKARIEGEVLDLEAKRRDQTQTIQARELISAPVKLARNCYSAYRKTSPETKKLWNQAPFAEIVVRNKKILKVTYQESFRTLLGIGGSNKTLLVELTHHNANHLDLGSDQVGVVWTNRFYEPEASARRSEIQKLRHENDSEFHERSLENLKRSRQARFWSEERILEAIRDFHSKVGRPPSYYDFRRTKELPDYATLWKRFGSIRVAISRALDEPVEQEKCSE